MNKNTTLLLLTGLFIFLNISCKKDSVKPVTSNGRYYPLGVGRYVTYQVDSILFNDVHKTSDTAHYQIMDLIDSAFTDNTGAQAFRINRMMRSDDSATWETIRLYYTNVTSSTAERVEENQRYIKLVFPIYNGESWNGNAHISTQDTLAYLNGWNYVYSDVNTSQYVNGWKFDSTLVVTQQNNENLIQKDLEQETYATGVGMVYKISEHVSKQDVTHGWDQPEKGYIIMMNIIDYGF